MEHVAIESIPFVEGVQLRLSFHIRITLKRVDGSFLQSTVTEWDVNEFLRKEFAEPIYNMSLTTRFFPESLCKV